LRNIIVDVSRFFSEAIPGVKGVSIGIIVLVLDGVFRSFLLIVELRARDVIELGIGECEIVDE
jgi:hypothetical protein